MVIYHIANNTYLISYFSPNPTTSSWKRAQKSPCTLIGRLLTRLGEGYFHKVIYSDLFNFIPGCS